MASAELLIDSDRLISNFRVLRAQASNRSVFAVIKARAYGHGAVTIARALEKAFSEVDLPYFCLARLEEVVELRAAEIHRPCLLMSQSLEDLKPRDIPEKTALCLSSDRDMENLLCWPTSSGNVKLHLHFNTGMNRLGFSCIALSEKETRRLFLEKISCLVERGFEIEGLMTHLACAEEDSGVFSSRQVTIFQNFLTTLKKEWQPKNGAFPRWCHIANSEGVLHKIGSERVFNAIRPGLHLWGVQESPTLLTRSKELKPVASVRGRIRQIHHLQKGEGVGYGLSYKAKGPETVATVNLGYADGLRRDASQTSLGLYVHGKKFRFVGRVSMDLCAVALPEKGSCVEGEWAYWICDEQNAETIALELGTISYEVLCACASRLQTVLIEGVSHG